MNRRFTLGLMSIGLLAVGGTLCYQDLNHPLGGPFLKVGLVTLAGCVAYRDVEKISLWTLGILLMALAVVAYRPRLIVLVIPILIAFWFLRPRGKT